ncbi:unnamed protein product [Leptidea sinapis]|uniref:Uncharacterized protein n=1 Tax=Leptidea sinapis TaxID=189913 RepID=A0A5E4PMI4_9NEOP|nr:unnamed protein product [Leptidea sinapis]
MRCRRRAVLALCSCVPHTLQPAVSDTLCTPEHLPCLHKHRVCQRRCPTPSIASSVCSTASDSTTSPTSTTCTTTSMSRIRCSTISL